MSAADRRSIEHAIDELAMLTGSIRVTVTEPGAAVTIDDHAVATTPLAAPLRANLGLHVVVVAKAGLEPIRKEVKVGGGDEATVEGPMQPEMTTGHLVVTAPPDAKVEVFVDGQDMGPAPWGGDVQPGLHVVESRGAGRSSLRRRGRRPATRARRGAAGFHHIDGTCADRHAHRRRLESPSTERSSGNGVWEGPLSAGEHRIAIEAAGFRPYRRALRIDAGETFVEDARLESTMPGGGVPYEGLYSGLEFIGFATPSGPSNGIAASCPSASCKSSSPLGAGLGVRVGYASGLEWCRGDGARDLRLLHSQRQRGHRRPPLRELRLPPFRRRRRDRPPRRKQGSHLRFTGALLGGFATMANIYKQDATAIGASGTSEQTSSTKTYTAPLLMADAGVLVGWANGAKVHVAFVTMLQFVGGAALAPALGSESLANGTFTTPALQVAQGTQISSWDR